MYGVECDLSHMGLYAPSLVPSLVMLRSIGMLKTLRLSRR